MSSLRRLGAPSATFLALMLICAVAMFLPFSPAHAQESGGSSVINFVVNSISGNSTSMRQVYDENYAALVGMGCWGCSVFDTFSSSVFSAGHTVATQNGGKLASVIVAVASLFSLVYVGKSFVSGDASDLLQRWKVFWQLMIAVAIGSAWLTTGNAFDNTWNVIYGPLMKIPLAVAKAVPQNGPSGSCAGGSSPSSMPSGAGPIVSDMRGVVCGGHQVTIKGIAFGLALANTGEGFIGTFVNIVVGVAIMVIFTWVMISFPLRFIDVLLRLTVVGIVTPVLVVCAVFKPTRQYIQVGVSNVLNAGSLFAFTSIMFNIGGAFFNNAVQDRINSMNQLSGTVQLSNSIVLVGAGIIFAAMLKMAPALAAEFSQFRGSSGGVGDAAASFSSSVVTLPIKAGTAVVAAKTGGAIAGKAAGGAMASNGGGGGVGNALGKGVSDKST